MEAKDSFWVKISTFIVDKRNIFFLFFVFAGLFCVVSRNWVQTNDDLTSYLPPDTETRQGLTIMGDEFITYASARVMVSNIPLDRALELKEALEERFGGQWRILNRAHHSSLKTAVASTLPYVLDANNYPDIQELMMAIDLGITDYSSWICDYVLRYKPGFLYTPDIENYKDNRGFYYPLQETPFPICSSNAELADKIRSFDLEQYQKATEKFLAARGCVDDGHASEKIVDMMQKLVEKG